MEIVRTILALAAVDLFAALPTQELEKVAAIAEWIEFKPGAQIITDGAAGDSLYLLAEGSVEIRKNGHRLATLSDGAVFGEMALLDQQPRSADVVAQSQATCLRIWRHDFEVLLLDQPAISRSIMQVLTRRLRAANEQSRPTDTDNG